MVLRLQEASRGRVREYEEDVRHQIATAVLLLACTTIVCQSSYTTSSLFKMHLLLS